jgi:dTDP-4-dehydrorhamnose 3,5-epimerase
MIEVRPTAIADVLVITTRSWEDERGSFSETYQQTRFAEAGIDFPFCQDNQALSRRTGTLRGLHYQRPTADQTKLVRVVRGAIFDVAVDLRPGSSTYGRWVAELLSAENRRQMMIPKGFAHGYQTLEPDCEVFYKVDAPYLPSLESGLRWNDPALAIAWPLLPPLVEPILAPRDRTLPGLAEQPIIEEWRVRP